jgi:tellurite methyltransferase
MPTDYETIYQQQRHALGDPTPSIVAFFDAYPKPSADVLDLGCGQGRDALFIARRGHRMVGVDLSLTGIEQLLADAKAESLPIQGMVADLRDFEPSENYDVVVLDRTLHLLAASERLTVLQSVSQATRPDGFVLITDEKSNMPAIKNFFPVDSAE